MPHEDDLFQIGDTVVKGDEMGRVIDLQNRSTGERFLMVWIMSGPRKNQREYPRHGWTVVLDYPEGTVPTMCTHCERGFISRARVLTDLGGAVIPRDEACYSCATRRRLV